MFKQLCETHPRGQIFHIEKTAKVTLIYNDEYIVARDTGKGYIEFPGGGVDENETPDKAVVREALEEAGAIVSDLRPIGVLFFDWDENWAKTEKQKARYEKFRGEEMHFFVGKVKKFVEASGDNVHNDPAWEGSKYLKISDVRVAIEELKPFPKSLLEYRNMQLQALLSASQE